VARDHDEKEYEKGPAQEAIAFSPDGDEKVDQSEWLYSLPRTPARVRNGQPSCGRESRIRIPMRHTHGKRHRFGQRMTEFFSFFLWLYGGKKTFL
jgi:hypothetical protein